MTRPDAVALTRPQNTFSESSRSADMVWIRGGTFRMGSSRHYVEEAPVHRVTVDAFWIDRTPVTNREFRQFVKATGYVTVAETTPHAKDYPGALPTMLKAGSLVFSPPTDRVVRSPSSMTIRSSTSPTAMLWHTRNGRARTCRPKQSGSLRPVVGSTALSSPGVMNSRPAASRWRTLGKARFRMRIAGSMDTSAPRR